MIRNSRRTLAFHWFSPSARSAVEEPREDAGLESGRLVGGDTLEGQAVLNH